MQDARPQKTSAAQHAAEKGHVHDHPEGTPCPSDTAHGADESHGLEGHTHGTPDTGPKIRTKSSFLPNRPPVPTSEVQEVKRGPFRETLRCGGEIYASQKRTVGRIGSYRGCSDASWTDAS